MSLSAIVIGGGFSGLSAAITLADQGHSVKLLEKNEVMGGRARQWKSEGFTFDLGPSWYWMPDVFESFFERFGKKVSDYYTLKRLSPSYRVYFKNETVDVPADYEELKAWFESREKGSAAKLDQFLAEAEYKYEVGINDLVYRPGRKLTEFLDARIIGGLFKLQLLGDISTHIRKFFKDPLIIELLEFPVLFLGERANKTPALYSLMNYADIKLGTWYPEGGMFEIVKALQSLAIEKGVEIYTETEVTGFVRSQKNITSVQTIKGNFDCDVVISGAEYHHTDKHLLPEEISNYSEKYWDSRKMAPSSLLFYLGINKKLNNLLHHNLFFDADFGQHSEEIYLNPKWPTDPLFYVSVPSMTDPTVAPEGMENVFLLIPLAPDLQDSDELREKYYHIIMERLEQRTGQNLRDHVVLKRSFAMNDFKTDYNAYKGNAYGLANTLLQTAILKPSLKNKNLNNLYYTGQLTVPGPGVPPSLISGFVVANEVMKDLKTTPQPKVIA